MPEIIICTPEELSSLIKASIKEAIQEVALSQHTPEDIGDISLAESVTELKRQTIYQYSNNGKIPVIRLGRLLRFSKIDLVKWMRENNT